VLTPIEPMHLHGHDMWVLNQGLGQWDGTVVNPGNPQRRDTQNLPPNGHIVIQYDLDNPGVWLFHCHLAWHLSSVSKFRTQSRPKQIPEDADAVLGFVCDLDGATHRDYPVSNSIYHGADVRGVGYLHSSQHCRPNRQWCIDCHGQ
jgi:hypothetical protein